MESKKKGSGKKISTDGSKKSTSKKPVKKVEEVEIVDHPDANEDLEQDDVEDTFFAEQILTEYKLPYEYHIFDPREYKYELHKEIVIVDPDQRITSEIMTAYEYTEIVSNRAKQIENGGPMFCDDPDGKCDGDPIKFAELEIDQKKCPLNILRMYNLNYGEIWQVNHMSLPL